MKKHFYSHIVETESIEIALAEMDISDQERRHLLEIAHSSLHHTVVDTILSELSPEDKEIFLDHLAANRHDEIWKLLNKKTTNIEEKIRLAAKELKKKLHEDIKEEVKKK